MSKTIEEQIAELKSAMATLAAQRAVLGDVVVDAALGPMKKQLSELEAQNAPPEQQRKQVTVLFADVSGFTKMSETMDPEEVSDTMNALWEQIDAVIIEHGGTIDKHIGDAVMALWGADSAREDDPERAMRAALGMQAALRKFTTDPQHKATLRMRIGINTGPVLLGTVGMTGEFTAMGDTVNLASRLEHAAPVGGILASYNTYRHARGVFNVEQLEPIFVKGKSEPIQVYLIHGINERAFRVGTRGIEGIETRMVGRRSEMQYLKRTLQQVIQLHETHLITIVADAGLGKSRLLYEFTKWLDEQPYRVWSFKGRAGEHDVNMPFSLMRYVISQYFHIQDSDSASVARQKMVMGITHIMGGKAIEAAHYIGHLLGFDFSSSPYLSDVLSDFHKIRSRAFHYLIQFFRVVSAKSEGPLIVFLEDVHWADDGSIDLLEYIVQECSDEAMMVISMARPTLFERRKFWGMMWDRHTQFELKPLDKEESNALIDELLQKLDHVPDMLREMIIIRAEGNPYYHEEIVKMLINDGVIVTAADKWQIAADRLSATKVPATLTGVLQARLDNLEPREKLILQRASVIGRVFWDDALFYLSRKDDLTKEDIGKALASLVQRELIYERVSSAFDNALEFIFKNTIFRDVTYESVLKRLRRTYHIQVAEWIIERSGERVNEYTGLIANHYEQAEAYTESLNYMQRAGQQAMFLGAMQQARSFFERSLVLIEDNQKAIDMPPTEVAVRQATIAGQLAEAHKNLSEYRAAAARYNQSLELSRQIDHREGVIGALYGLAEINHLQGNYDAAIQNLQDSLKRIASDDPVQIAHVLGRIGSIYWAIGNYPSAKQYLQDGLSAARKANLKEQAALWLGNLGALAHILQEYDEAQERYEESIQIAREIGDKNTETTSLKNLGELYYDLGNYQKARQYLQENIERCEELGDLRLLAASLSFLGLVAIALEDLDMAREKLQSALKTALDIGAIPEVMEALTGIAKLLVNTGQTEQALVVLGHLKHSPATPQWLQDRAQELIATLETTLPVDTLTAGIERGRALALPALANSLLTNAIG